MKRALVALAAVAAMFAMSFVGPASALEPGAYGSVSRDAVQSIVNQVYPPILDEMKKIVVPTVEGKESGFYYKLSNFKLKQLDIRSIDVATNGVLRVDIRDTVIKTTLDWKYKKKKIPWIPRGSGWLEANLHAGDIGGAFTVSTIQTPTGLKPVVKLSGLTVEINEVKIKTHGSLFSWLYNLVIKLFKSKIRNLIVDFVKNGIVNAVNNASDKIINQMTFRGRFGKWGTIDYSLTSNMVFNNGLIVAPLNGEVYPVATNKSDGATPRPTVPYTPSTRMLSFVVSSFVVNSALHVHYASGIGARYYTEAEHPKLFPLGFNTNGYALIVPGLPLKYPNAQMTYRFRGVRESNVAITAANGIAWDSLTRLSAFVAGKTPEEDTHVFDIIVDLKAGGSVTVTTAPPEPPTIFIVLSGVKPAFTVEKSSVGDVDLALFNALLQQTINDVILPAFNAIFADGIPILSPPGFGFANTVLKPIDSGILLETDISYTPALSLIESVRVAASHTDRELSTQELRVATAHCAELDE